MRHARHRGALIEKWKESLRSVLPITAIVIALGLLAVPAPSGAMLAFLAGAVLLVVGMGLFTLGTDLAMIPIGEHVGAAMTRSKKLWVVLLCSFLVGVIVTISEPDLQVLAHQVPGVPDLTLIVSVALGVGGDMATDAFGVVAMVAMTPLITLQVLGLVFKRKQRALKATAPQAEAEEIIE